MQLSCHDLKFDLPPPLVRVYSEPPLVPGTSCKTIAWQPPQTPQASRNDGQT